MSKLKLMTIIGTRPEIIKMSPIIRACEEKEIDYFIRRKHAVHTAHPNHRTSNLQPQYIAVDKGFRGHIVADMVLPKHRHAKVVVAAVIQGKGYNTRQQAQVKEQGFFSVSLQTIDKGT